MKVKVFKGFLDKAIDESLQAALIAQGVHSAKSILEHKYLIEFKARFDSVTNWPDCWRLFCYIDAETCNLKSYTFHGKDKGLLFLERHPQRSAYMLLSNHVWEHINNKRKETGHGNTKRVGD